MIHWGALSTLILATYVQSMLQDLVASVEKGAGSNEAGVHIIDQPSVITAPTMLVKHEPVETQFMTNKPRPDSGWSQGFNHGAPEDQREQRETGSGRMMNPANQLRDLPGDMNELRTIDPQAEPPASLGTITSSEPKTYDLSSEGIPRDRILLRSAGDTNPYKHLQISSPSQARGPQFHNESPQYNFPRLRKLVEDAHAAREILLKPDPPPVELPGQYIQGSEMFKKSDWNPGMSSGGRQPAAKLIANSEEPYIKLTEQRFKDLRLKQRVEMTWSQIGAPLQTLPPALQDIIPRLHIPTGVSSPEAFDLLTKWDDTIEFLAVMRASIPHFDVIASSLLNCIEDLVMNERVGPRMKEKILVLLLHHHSYIVHEGNEARTPFFDPETWKEPTAATMNFLLRLLDRDHKQRTPTAYMFEPTPMTQMNVETYLQEPFTNKAREVSIGLASEWMLKKAQEIISDMRQNPKIPHYSREPSESSLYHANTARSRQVYPGRMSNASPNIFAQPPNVRNRVPDMNTYTTAREHSEFRIPSSQGRPTTEDSFLPTDIQLRGWAGSGASRFLKRQRSINPDEIRRTPTPPPPYEIGSRVQTSPPYSLQDVVTHSKLAQDGAQDPTMIRGPAMMSEQESQSGSQLAQSPRLNMNIPLERSNSLKESETTISPKTD